MEGAREVTSLLWGGLFSGGPVAGLALNVVLSLGALALGAFLGVPLGALRAVTPLWLHAPVALVLAVLRSTPPLLLVLWCYLFIQLVLVLPLQPLWIGCIALGLYALTHISDIVKAGIRAVPRDLIRTSYALGLTRAQTARHVLLPVSLRVMLPALISFGSALFKESSVCYVIGVVELVQLGLLRSTLEPGRLLRDYALVAALFFVVCSVMTRLASVLEAKARLRGTGLSPAPSVRRAAPAA